MIVFDVLGDGLASPFSRAASAALATFFPSEKELEIMPGVVQLEDEAMLKDTLELFVSAAIELQYLMRGSFVSFRKTEVWLDLNRNTCNDCDMLCVAGVCKICVVYARVQWWVVEIVNTIIRERFFVMLVFLSTYYLELAVRKQGRRTTVLVFCGVELMVVCGKSSRFFDGAGIKQSPSPPHDVFSPKTETIDNRFTHHPGYFLCLWCEQTFTWFSVLNTVFDLVDAQACSTYSTASECGAAKDCAWSTQNNICGV